MYEPDLSNPSTQEAEVRDSNRFKAKLGNLARAYLKKKNRSCECHSGVKHWSDRHEALGSSPSALEKHLRLITAGTGAAGCIGKAS